MAALGTKLRTAEGGRFLFWCPGCDEVHMVGASWGFNGDGDKPTFTPSILVQGGHFSKGTPPGNCWCDFEKRTGQKSDFECGQCHSFVTDGRIQFLGDCSHKLAGQTVDLPDFDPQSPDAI